MTNVPKPQRKAASVSMTPNAPVPGVNPGLINHKSAAPFGSVDKSAYNRRSVGISPASQPINDEDAGKGIGNVRGGGPNKGGVNSWSGKAPFAD